MIWQIKKRIMDRGEIITVFPFDVSSLGHKTGDYAMKSRAFVVQRNTVSLSLLTGTEGAEVLGSYRHDRRKQLKHESTGRRRVDGDVKKHFGMERRDLAGKRVCMFDLFILSCKREVERPGSCSDQRRKGQRRRRSDKAFPEAKHRKSSKKFHESFLFVFVFVFCFFCFFPLVL